MRVLGVDYGLARIGIAVSDPTGTIASPHSVVETKDKGDQVRRVAQLAADLQVARIVVGIPFEMSGHAGEMAQMAEKYAIKLGEVTGLEVVRWDERFTSVQAERSMRASSKKGRKRKGRTIADNIDKVAAALILQSWLDGQPS